ncbi:MAG: 2-dehydropantoate 2-reductase [Propionibacteriaceae bacterium]|jgi:2-dehydropantoate 2-reductase|nr:2-dehydropantoate 2-reductase [Propionibacteriaceae bacterium]
MDIAIVGMGAIGTYYGVRLALAGNTVHFLAHTEYEAVKAGGLHVKSYLGNFDIDAPLVYNSIEAMPPCDMVCVCTKATTNDTIFGSLTPVVKPGGAILLMQNGFGAEERLARLYPDVRIFAGLCFITSYRVSPGHINHDAYGKISLASLVPDAQGLADLYALFTGAGLEAEVIGDVLPARFRKLVWNIPYNGLTVALDCTTLELASGTAALSSVRTLMTEVVEGAAACGVTIDPSFVDEMMGTTQNMGAYEPSMKIDYNHHRPLEVEAIYRKVIAYTADHGYRMAATSLLADELDIIQARYLSA